VFHVKLGRSLLLASGLLIFPTVACESPSDAITDPPSFTPLEDREGRYRVTWGTGPDGVRGFLPDGRLLFRTFDLDPFGEAWILASAPLDGGVIREEAAVYRPAILYQMGHLTSDGAQRVLTAWHGAIPGFHGCRDSSMTTDGTPPPPTPSPVAITLYTLPPGDGTPLSSLPARFVPMTTVTGAGTATQRVRLSPAGRDAHRDNANPFGPVLLPGSTEMIYSDGDRLWRANVSDTTVPLASIGVGAYPALSPDGGTLAYSRPVGLDSTVRRFFVPQGFVGCSEEFVDVTAATWELILRDLESGAETVLGEGRDPAFDPVAGRLVVRGPDLRWLDLTTGLPSPIPVTTGAFAPAISADGGILAFSLINPDTRADVYFLRLTR